MAKAVSKSFLLSNSSQKPTSLIVLMYSLYGHPRYFNFKRKYQQYDTCFQTIFPFLLFFSMFMAFLILQAYSMGQKKFPKSYTEFLIDIIRLEFRKAWISHLKLCSALFQISCIRCYTQFAVLYMEFGKVSATP